MTSSVNAKWVVVFSGARDRYQVPLALAKTGRLNKLVSDFYAPLHGMSVARHIASKGVIAKLNRRYEGGLDSNLVSWSACRLLSDYVVKRSQTDRDRRLATTAGKLARNSGCGLLSYSYYGYDGFHEYGINRCPKVLMQVHPHPIAVRKILHQELELSEFGRDSLLGEQELCSDERRFERLATEAHLADHCIVASSFTERTLIENGVPKDRIHRVPYGVDIGCDEARGERSGTFRVLFVGQMVQRKGVEYLLRAWKKLRLPNAELVLAGRGRVDQRLLGAFRSEFMYMGNVSDATLGYLYNNSDMFCMPSLVEGFGLVYLEALARSLPIIATPNTGAADIIQDGREGFVVPIRDVDALAEKLEWAYRNRSALSEMRIAARSLAMRHSWEKFRAGIVNVVQQIEADESCTKRAAYRAHTSLTA